MSTKTPFAHFLSLLGLSPAAFAIRYQDFEECERGGEKIKNIARGMSTISSQLAARLENDYGVQAESLFGKKGECIMFDGLPATSELFESWRGMRLDPELAEKTIERACKILNLILKKALAKGHGD